MKKVLLSAIFILFSCVSKSEVPTDSAEAPEVQYRDGGGYFTPPETAESDSNEELFCYVEHFEETRGPWEVDGLFLQGPFVGFDRTKTVETSRTGEYIYLVDAKVISTDEYLHTFTKRAEVWVEDDLVAWVDEVPRDVYEMRPNFNGQVNLAKYGTKFDGRGLLWARYPKHKTEISIWMRFRRHYGCRNSQ